MPKNKVMIQLYFFFHLIPLNWQSKEYKPGLKKEDTIFLLKQLKGDTPMV